MKTQSLAKHIINDLEYLGRFITSVLMFFYLSQLLWPYIVLPYSNPYDSHGNLAQIQFNPLNNSLRLVTVLMITILGPILVSLLSKKCQKIIMRVIFVILLGVSYFLIALVTKAGFPEIDFLHDGIKLGNASLFLTGRRLYSELLFLHGAFLDPLVAVVSFFLFGRSIGSFFLFTGFLLLISLVLFFIFLVLTVESDLIFYLSSLWFFNFLSGSNNLAPVNFSVSHIRDILVWAVLILLWLVIKRPESKKLLFIIGFLSGLQYFISFDRAYFLTLFAFFLFIVFSLFSIERSSKEEVLKYKFLIRKKHLRNNIKRSRLIIAGLAVGFFFQLPLMGLESFKEFLKIAFWQYPRMIGNFSEQEFTLISQHSTFTEGLMYWLPILLIIFNGIILTNQVVAPLISHSAGNNKIRRLDPKYFYALTIYVLSIIFFRSALVRTGIYHLNYASTITFFLTFFILDCFFLKSKRLIGKSNYYSGIKYLTGFIFLFWVLFTYNLPHNYQMKEFVRPSSQCVFYPEKENFSLLTAYLGELYFCPPYHSPEDIRGFFDMRKQSDRFWFTEPTIKVVDYLNQNTTADDYVFVFNNEAIYYYLLKAKSPTRFASIKLADTNFFRDEALNDLKKHSPKYIIYTTGGTSETMEGVHMRDRFVEINSWLLDNYPQKITIGSAIVLAK